MKYFYSLVLLTMMSMSVQAHSCDGYTIIDQSNMSFTITEPGAYCLVETVTGSITINASEVLLDLGGFDISESVTGISIVGQSEVKVCNGTIRNMSDTGIAINSSTNITLSKLDFIGNNAGAFVFTSTWVTIDDCTFRNHSDAAIRIADSGTSQITNTLCTRNNSTSLIELTYVNNIYCNRVLLTENQIPAEVTGQGLVITNGSNSNFVNCSVNNNKTLADSSFFAFYANESSNLKFYDCIANSNETPGFLASYIVNASNRITFDTCTSNTNKAYGPVDFFSGSTIGFFILTSDRCAVVNCTIEGNEATGGAQGISQTADATQCMIRNNTIRNNIGAIDSYGIFILGSENAIWSNMAQGHATDNFQGTMPIVTYDTSTGTFSATPTPYDNISVE